MQELTYCHPPFRREQHVHVLTERSNHLLHTGSAAGGAGTERKARICLVPLLTPPLGCHGKEARVHRGRACPEKPSVASAKLVTLCPAAHRVHTYLSRGAHGQPEICPTLPWSQGCRELGPGPSVGLGRRRCANPSFGLMKTSVTSERLFVLTGIVI